MRNLDTNSVNPIYNNEHLSSLLDKENNLKSFLKDKVEQKKVSPQIIRKIKNKIKVSTY